MSEKEIFNMGYEKANNEWQDKIKDKIKEFEKPLLDIAEEQKFPFKYTLDGLSAIQDGVKKVLGDLLKENNNNVNTDTL